MPNVPCRMHLRRAWAKMKQRLLLFEGWVSPQRRSLEGVPAVEDMPAPAHVPHMNTETASFDISAISPADAGHALWFFAGATTHPGIFTEHLMAAIAHADPVNRLILAAAFPGTTAAMELAGRQDGGLQAINAIALASRASGLAR